MLHKLFNRTEEKELDWSGLERRPGEDPLGVMLKHYGKFKLQYAGYSDHYVWQRWIRH